MSSGNWSVTLDSRNYASKAWSGANTPKGQPYRENAYNVDHTTRRESGYHYWLGGAYQGVTHFSWVAPYLDILPDSYVTEADTKNRNDLIQKIKGGVNLGVATAELPKTVDSIVKSSRAVLGSLLLLKRGDVTGSIRTLLRGLQGVDDKHGFTSRAARLRNERHKFQKSSTDSLSVKDVASTWLAWQYAWSPLLSDIHGAMEDLEKLVHDRELVFRKKTSYTQVLKEARTTQYGGENIVQIKLPTTKQAVVRRKMVLAEPPSYAWSSGLLDPAVIAWEIVPFSFVFDWFAPIGGSLEAWSSAPFLTVKSWTKSWLRETYAVVKDHSFRNTSGYIKAEGGNFFYRKVLYARSVGDNIYSLLASEPEHPFVPLNKAEKAFSLTHLANAAALITGIVSNTRGEFAKAPLLAKHLRSIR